jgi:glycosyltransferase involved in cell wall biosynthesis
MRIVYLAQSVIPSRTANSIHVMKMCQAFASAGHDVTLLLPDKPEVEPGVRDVFEFYGVDPCFELKKLPWYSIKGKVQLYGLIASRLAAGLQPDLVYGRFLSGCAQSAFRRLAVVYEAHAAVRDLGRLSEWLFRRMIRARSYRRTVVITSALRDHYIKRYADLDCRLLVAPDAADCVPQDLRPISLEPNSRTLQVGYTGHLYPGKGMDLIAELAPRCSWAHFHIVGGTPVEIEHWKQVTARSQNITFHGFQPHSATAAYRAAFDVVLAPYQGRVLGHGGMIEISRWMSPLKVFEYMASGKAIIASDLPVLREVLQHDRNALLCPAADAEAWKRALERLRDDPRLMGRLGCNALDDFRHHYTWRARAGRVIEALPPA